MNESLLIQSKKDKGTKTSILLHQLVSFPAGSIGNKYQHNSSPFCIVSALSH